MIKIAMEVQAETFQQYLGGFKGTFKAATTASSGAWVASRALGLDKGVEIY